MSGSETKTTSLSAPDAIVLIRNCGASEKAATRMQAIISDAAKYVGPALRVHDVASDGLNGLRVAFLASTACLDVWMGGDGDIDMNYRATPDAAEPFDLWREGALLGEVVWAIRWLFAGKRFGAT